MIQLHLLRFSSCTLSLSFLGFFKCFFFLSQHLQNYLETQNKLITNRSYISVVLGFNILVIYIFDSSTGQKGLGRTKKINNHSSLFKLQICLVQVLTLCKKQNLVYQLHINPSSQQKKEEHCTVANKWQFPPLQVCSAILFRYIT